MYGYGDSITQRMTDSQQTQISHVTSTPLCCYFGGQDNSNLLTLKVLNF